MSDELAIRLRGAVKRYGQITAVNGLDLDVPVGTCVGLLGPNGAGKSTTMRLLTAQAMSFAPREPRACRITSDAGVLVFARHAGPSARKQTQVTKT